MSRQAINIMKACIIFACIVLFGMGVILLSSCSDNPRLSTPETSSDTIENNQENEGIFSGQGELNAAAQYFLANGLIDENEYHADQYVTRIIAAEMIADITGLSKEAQNTSFSHPFVDISSGSEQLIGFLYHNNIIEGITNNHYMETELCDETAFLAFLLRAISYVGGDATRVDMEDAYPAAMETGILLSDDQKDDKALLVNDAFEICYSALYAEIGSEGHTLLSYLMSNGTITQPRAEVAAAGADAFSIVWPELQPFFTDNFNDSTLEGSSVSDKRGNTCWYGGNVPGAQNSITEDGCLEMAGRNQDLAVNQQYALLKKWMQGNESYGMTFTVNVQKMSNEGNESRAIFRVIPRTADARVTKYYAVNYYIVQTLGEFQSNLFRCKWSITNTNAPSGTEPLAEAFFLLKEKEDYTARLLMENTDEGNVHIAFYIDGADRQTNSTTPLLEYTDTSAYKILQSATGPAFGISGHIGALWGFASRVRFDNVALYNVEDFEALHAQLIRSAGTPVIMEEGNEFADQLHYLVNHGIIMPDQRRVDFDTVVSLEEFLATALYLNGQHMVEGQTIDTFTASALSNIFRRIFDVKNTDSSRPVTRYEAAEIIRQMLPGEIGSTKYESLYQDQLERAYKSAVYFAVQNGYLLLDDENRFNGNDTISRSELLRIFSLAVDARLRTCNSVLTIPSIFSDFAVLQQNKPIIITGKGMSGDTVTVRLGDLQTSAKVADGEWSVEFPAQPYGGPYVLSISDSGYRYKLRGVYIGEVVVVAGQSNAEMSVAETINAAEMISKYGSGDNIRVFRPDSIPAVVPNTAISKQWETTVYEFSSYVIRDTSAIGVYYIDQLKALNPDLKNVKFGIIQLTYGGTSIEMFMPQSINEENGYVQKDDEFIRSGFWNGYMEGVTPYSAGILLYYQGENSTHLRYMYEPLLRDYIKGVRRAFCDDALPLLLVQISGYGDNYGQENDSWPYIREVQMRVANTTENVGLVTSIDLEDNDAQEIHPRGKQPIGVRLAYLAMNIRYGQDLGMESPVMTGYTLNENVFSMRFNTASLRLDETVNGVRDFEVLSAEGDWQDAEARVEGDTLFVWSDNVVVPFGVRYAWSNYPKADLFGQNGLPVLPFNTTKDLNTPIDGEELTTNAHQLKKAYHQLNTGDAVANLTRDNSIRHVREVNAYILEYTDGDIPGQAPGDEISLLKKQKDGLMAEEGTTGTILKATAHGLRAGDWLYNVKYQSMTPVLEVIDENTVRVEMVDGQSDGNLLEVYRCIANVIAEQ